MSLSDLASLGSFVSGVAVLVSLVFLYVQLRQLGAQISQSEKNQRALLSQGVILRAIETNDRFIESAALDVLLKARSGATDFSERETAQLGALYRNVSLHYQEVLLQHRSGLLDQGVFDTIMQHFRNHVGIAAFRAYWKTSRATASAEWAAFVDTLIAETPLRRHLDAAAQFNANIEEILRP